MGTFFQRLVSKWGAESVGGGHIVSQWQVGLWPADAKFGKAVASGQDAPKICVR